MIGTHKDQHSQFIICFGKLIVLLAKYENQLQAIRQLLTLNNDFNPEGLFKYLAMGEQELTRAHIIYFLEENNKQIRQQQAKLLLNVYGYHTKLSYSDFLDYIYPFDIEAIKTISKVLCKKYMKYDKQEPTQKILCIFLLLIEKQLEFLHAFDELKNQHLLSIGTVRESVKLIIRVLKKSIPQPLVGISSDFIITFPEFKAIMEKFVDLPEVKIQTVCRRLSMQKEEFIGLDELEIWLKPWFKQRQEEGSAHTQSPNPELKEISQNLIA